MEPATSLTTAGWVFLTVAWGSFSAFTAYCFYRVMHIDKEK